MKKYLTSMLLLFTVVSLSAQVKIYNPQADAKADIGKAVAQAKRESKHVLVQVGGNWCPWCIKLHRYFGNQPKIKALLDSCYVVVHVNYDKKSKHSDTMRMLGNPQRFGFPVLVILDENGKRIHTQDSGLLESGQGYDFKKVYDFLRNWTYRAIR